ncbi:MAG: O-antigen ligase family protein [Thermoleophilaceae bacterium]
MPLEGYLALVAVLGLLGAAALAYLAWRLDPAWLLTAALLLSVFNNHWDAFGLPSNAAPDRLFLIAGLAAVLLRAPAARDRPSLRPQPVHALLALTLLWAVGSAIAAGTLTDRTALFGLLDRFAVPFALVLVAPLAFRTARQRTILLSGLVAFGGYLGLTALFETLGPRALVFPQFILDPSHGLHGGRARGPFLEANANGVGLFAGGVAALVAASTWRSWLWRAAAIAVAVLCAAGLLFTLTRSVWLASIVSTLLVLTAAPRLRPLTVPAVAAGAVFVIALLNFVPGLETRAQQRKDASRSVSERKNVNAAALAMVSERPIVGFGWSTFRERNAEYFPLLDDVPQTAELHLGIHNVPLLFATELGLMGTLLYVLSFAGVIGSAALGRGPPTLDPWRAGLLAVAVFWVVVALFAPIGQVFPLYITWLWAAVILGASRRPAER